MIKTEKKILYFDEPEITLLAAEAGAIPIDEEVIAIAGTGWLGGGADCAIVLRPSVLLDAWFIDAERGLEIREIIAIPRGEVP